MFIGFFDGLEQQLRDILYDDPILIPQGYHRCLEHAHAKWAGGSNHTGMDADGLPDA